MVAIQTNFQKLKSPYIFPIIEKKIEALENQHSGGRLINLGVGDINFPLSSQIAKAICDATLEMSRVKKGYGPCQGYPFLREAIHKNEYEKYGIAMDEIFISDGANPDASAIQELFAEDSVVGIVDPTYPVYRDANLLAGKKLYFIETTEENDFVPTPPNTHIDFVYLCTPANPTGVALTRKQLQKWVNWARENQVILIIDSVYSGFITSTDVPLSIYELEGANEVAIELRSFSKNAGFTGLRCGYNVVPKTLFLKELNALWVQRMDIRTNGVSYPIQRGAEAVFTKEAQLEIKAQIAIYQEGARLLLEALTATGQKFYGGVDAPYIFWKAPDGNDSWAFFDQLLNHSKIISIPGSGFGKCGENFVRLSCFINQDLAKRASYALYNHFATT